MIESALRAHLLADTAIANLIGTRFYPFDQMPQGGTLPAITYQTISNIPNYVLSGDSGYAIARIQMDCWADEYSTVKDIAEAIRLAVSGFAGTLNGHQVRSVTVQDNGDLPEALEPGAETGPRRASMDLRIGYTQAVPSF